MDGRIVAAAEERGGYFTRTDVLACGYRDRDITAAVRAGVWARVRVGTYAAATTWNALRREDQSRLRLFAVLDKLGPGVAGSHPSACSAHRIEQYDADLDTVHVTRFDGRSGRREAGVVYHQGVVLPERDVVEVDGHLVTCPSRAVWEAASLTSLRGGVVAADSALHGRACTAEELADTARRLRNWRGGRHVDIALRLADPGAESPGESLTRYLCYEQRLPRPVLQYEVRDSSGVVIARTDFAWEEYAHLGEFDGLMKYTRGLSAGETASEVVIREKRREDKVRRCRQGMSRLIWPEVLPMQARATGLILRHDLEQSRSLYLHNRTSFAV